MPTYDYKCGSCNHTFEVQSKIDARNKPIKAPCPSCKAKKSVEMIFGSPAICDPIRIGTQKADKGWNEVLSKVEEGTRQKIRRSF